MIHICFSSYDDGTLLYYKAQGQCIGESLNSLSVPAKGILLFLFCIGETLEYQTKALNVN